MTYPAYYFYSDLVTRLVSAVEAGAKTICLSLDLNRSQKTWQIRGNRLILDDDTGVDIQDLAPAFACKNKIFMFQDRQLLPLEVRADGYYKLVPTKGAPTLEINGIKMHRSKDIDPLVDAKLKTRLVAGPGDTVLDTCGGLGYSAMFTLKAGAKKVVSTEKSRAVIQLRNLNPWSKPFADERLEWIHGDITRAIEGFETGSFNGVVHDPPRFTSATGDLYGKLFYAQLFRVMTCRSKLFHYTGSPKKIKAGDTFIKNTIKRLEITGFHSVCFQDNLQGIYAQKN
jgi:hypothetical protein